MLRAISSHHLTCLLLQEKITKYKPSTMCRCTMLQFRCDTRDTPAALTTALNPPRVPDKVHVSKHSEPQGCGSSQGFCNGRISAGQSLSAQPVAWQLVVLQLQRSKQRPILRQLQHQVHPRLRSRNLKVRLFPRCISLAQIRLGYKQFSRSSQAPAT